MSWDRIRQIETVASDVNLLYNFRLCWHVHVRDHTFFGQEWQTLPEMTSALGFSCVGHQRSLDDEGQTCTDPTGQVETASGIPLALAASMFGLSMDSQSVHVFLLRSESWQSSYRAANELERLLLVLDLNKTLDTARRVEAVP